MVAVPSCAEICIAAESNVAPLNSRFRIIPPPDMAQVFGALSRPTKSNVSFSTSPSIGALEKIPSFLAEASARPRAVRCDFIKRERACSVRDASKSTGASSRFALMRSVMVCSRMREASTFTRLNRVRSFKTTSRKVRSRFL